MSAWKYKSLMPKVIVSKLRLISPKDLADMCGRSLDVILSMLAKTPYRFDIESIPSQHLDSVSTEKSLFRNLARTFEEIIECSPKNIGFLLSVIQRKFEASNVKAMLRAIKANLNVDEAMGYIIPAGRLDEANCRKKLESSKGIADFADALSDSEYGAILKDALGENEGTIPLHVFEAAMDKYAYGRIWKAATKLRGLDGKIARNVLGIEIDSANLKVILRCKALGLGESQIKQYLIYSSNVFGENDLENAIKAVDVKSSIELLLSAARLVMVRDHQYMLVDLLKEYESSQSLSQLEMVLDRSLLKANLRMLKRYTPFFNIGAVLAFLNLKWFEVRNLRAIVRGAEGNIPPQEIKKLLLLPD